MKAKIKKVGNELLIEIKAGDCKIRVSADDSWNFAEELHECASYIYNIQILMKCNHLTQLQAIKKLKEIKSLMSVRIGDPETETECLRDIFCEMDSNNKTFEQVVTEYLKPEIVDDSKYSLWIDGVCTEAYDTYVPYVVSADDVAKHTERAKRRLSDGEKTDKYITDYIDNWYKSRGWAR